MFTKDILAATRTVRFRLISSTSFPAVTDPAVTDPAVTESWRFSAAEAAGPRLACRRRASACNE